MSEVRGPARTDRPSRGGPVGVSRFAGILVLALSLVGIGQPSALGAQNLPPESGLLPSTRPTDPLEGMLRDGFALTASRELARRLAEEAAPDDGIPSQPVRVVCS